MRAFLAWSCSGFLLWGISFSFAEMAEKHSLVDQAGILRWKEDHSEIALFGVNYYAPFSVDYQGLGQLGEDHRKTIERDAEQFRRLGLTAIRLHVFDREVSDTAGNLLDSDRLDLFDYLVWQCKKRGIYTVLTPIAWWGGTTPKSGFSSLYTKPEMVLDPEARKAQTRYLRQFMNHVNRYTGKAYREEPAIVAIEIINEPLYSWSTTDDQIKAYIDALAEAVRSTGARQPVFYNAWSGKEKAVSRSTADGCTFGWYPTGLAAGHRLKSNFLPQVDDYPRMRLPCLKNKAKIVYEFDAADVDGRVMYPAIARTFRSGGAQIATQFQYDPTPLAFCNYGWKTHYLNLVYAPGKTISFAIAAEVFHRVPRLARFPRYPANTRFGPFHLSFEQDLSEMLTESKFYYANTTESMPRSPEKLEHLMGCGSSPLVKYTGTGAYFLDRLYPGAWRLELYPDAVITADPHGRTNLKRTVSRLLWRTYPMKLRLPDLGPNFSISPLDNLKASSPAGPGGIVRVSPGAYVLTRKGLTKPGQVASEFYAPKPKSSDISVWCEVEKRWPRGLPMPVQATVASPQPIKRVIFHCGDRAEELKLRTGGPYAYFGEVPGKAMKPGRLRCWVEVISETDKSVFPRGADIIDANSPKALVCEITRNTKVPELRNSRFGRFEADAARVPGSRPDHSSLRVHATGFLPAPCATGLQLPAQPAPRGLNTLCVRARAVEPGTGSVEFGLVQADGRAYGAAIPLWNDWFDYRLPLKRLHPLWHTKGGQLNPAEIKTVSLVFGAWLYRGRETQPHGFEFERAWLETKSSGWEVEVIEPASGILLYSAEEHSLRLNGLKKGVRQSLVRGNSPLHRALRVGTRGFGPPPSCVSFRNTVRKEFDRWRPFLKKCDAVELIARAAHSSTNSLEIVLVESDGAPWGLAVPLKTEWQTIVIPLKKLRFFDHWAHIEGRGGKQDHFHPERVTAVNFCFGAWLYGKRFAEPHAVEVESLRLVKQGAQVQ